MKSEVHMRVALRLLVPLGAPLGGGRVRGGVLWLIDFVVSVIRFDRVP